VLFEQASTPVPATLPALASLLTGRYPGGHPVRTNTGRLSPGIPVLAEVLTAAGYSTGAFYGNSLLGSRSGLDRGFQAYTSFVPLSGPSDAEGARLASAWIAEPLSEPWFLWVHFMDPHGPYTASPIPMSGAGEAVDPLPDAVLPFSATNYGLGVIPKYQRLGDLDHASEYRRRYRGEVQLTDTQVGRLLAVLDEHRLWERTLVVLSADHGESLGEHDYYFQHGWLVHEPSLRVPLIVRVPAGDRGRRVQEPVSLVDILPTMLAGLDLPLPPGLEGRDLRPALAGRDVEVGPSFAVSAYLNQVTAIRRGAWKLVHTPVPPTAAPGDPWAAFYARQASFALFDLTNDPGELRDLAGEQSERARGLQEELLAWEKVHGIPFGERNQVDLDPATRERLDALGYGP
jgi:arylsulfatase A-like enzyme